MSAETDQAIADLASQVVSLQEATTDLTDRIDELEAGQGERYPRSIIWPDLSEPERQKAVAVLRLWVETHLFQFTKIKLTACWHQHPDVLCWLDTFRTMWFGAYTAKQPPYPTMPFEMWTIRLDELGSRLDGLSACRRGHVPPDDASQFLPDPNAPTLPEV